MTVLVKYELVNVLANIQRFEQYLTVAPSRMYGNRQQFPLLLLPLSTLVKS